MAAFQAGIRGRSQLAQLMSLGSRGFWSCAFTQYLELSMGWSSSLLPMLAVAAWCTHSRLAHAESAQVARGKYLVELGGCNHCHTPGYFFGKPDMSRFLAGSEVGFEQPGLGTFVGPNLTPDRETGLGNWTKEEMVTAIQTGVRPDGRILSPVMPWRTYAGLTKSDASDIVDYLRSLPPVSYKVPGPFGPDEKPAIFRMKLLPPEDTAQRN